MSHVRAPKGSPILVARIFDSGYMGVTLFFLLSGFVLSHRYFDELARPDVRAIGRYVRARLARIYPVYLAVLGFIVLQLHEAYVPLSGLGWHLFALQAWQSDLNKAFAYNPPAWSISIEFFLYACFPLVVLALARLRARGLVAVAVVAVIVVATLAWWWSSHDAPRTDPASSHHWLYRWPPTRLGDFVVGIVLARLCRRTRCFGGYVAVAGLLLIALAMSSETLFYTAWGWDAAYILPAAAVVGGLAIAPGSSIIARALSRPLMVQLGEASFVFYLIHLRMIGILGAVHWQDQGGMGMIALEVAFTCIIWCTAVGIHQLLELPAQRALTGRRRKTLQPDSVAAR